MAPDGEIVDLAPGALERIAENQERALEAARAQSSDVPSLDLTVMKVRIVKSPPSEAIKETRAKLLMALPDDPDGPCVDMHVVKAQISSVPKKS